MVLVDLVGTLSMWEDLYETNFTYNQFIKYEIRMIIVSYIINYRLS